jgi:hypothetical protein
MVGTHWKLVEIEYHFGFVFCFLGFLGEREEEVVALLCSAVLCGLYKFEGLKLFLYENSNKKRCQ